MRVTSPVAGAVQMFYVEDEVDVEEGDTLIGIEAMKVMFPIKSPCAGKVYLKVVLGNVVRKGQLLAEVL